MSSILINNATIVNEGRTFKGDLLIIDELIAEVGNIGPERIPAGAKIIDARGLLILPGIIDDQVHFREPGLTHKGDILSESRAAAAGGVTSFMDMPNTIPQTVSIAEWEKKNELAAGRSYINYSFYLGATDVNSDELFRADPAYVPGIKLFLGASTGNMLVSNEQTLDTIFSI